MSTFAIDPLLIKPPKKVRRQVKRRANQIVNPALAAIDRSSSVNANNIAAFNALLNASLSGAGGRVGGATAAGAGIVDAFANAFDQGANPILAGLAGVGGRGIASAGGAASAMAERFPEFLTAQGQQLLRESERRAATQREDIINQLPEIQQNILSELINQSIQIRSAEDARRALGLDEAQFEESKRRFDVDVDERRKDRAADAAAADAAADADADADKKDRRARKRARREARETEVAVAFGDLTQFVSDQLVPQFADKVAGQEPIVVGEVPDPDSLSGRGKIPLYAAPGGGTTTDVNEAATKPIFGGKIQLSTPGRVTLRRRVQNQLAIRLKRFGVKPARIKKLTEQILDQFFEPQKPLPPFPIDNPR